MRKISSKHKDGKKQKRNQLIFGIGLVAVMLFSIIGFGFRGGSNDEGKTIDYNGFEFIEQNGYWYVQIGNFLFSFATSPLEVEEMDLELNDLESYYEKPLYIYSENSGAEIEIYRNLDKIILRRQYACIEGESCEEDVPVKTCEDNFIIIKEAEETKVEQEENCVFIEGKQEDLVSIVDGVLFKVLGIN